MRPLAWSRNGQGNWNGKVGPLTLFVVAWHTGRRQWLVISKLPGGKTKAVGGVAEGQALAGELWERFLELVTQ